MSSQQFCEVLHWAQCTGGGPQVNALTRCRTLSTGHKLRHRTQILNVRAAGGPTSFSKPSGLGKSNPTTDRRPVGYDHSEGKRTTERPLRLHCRRLSWLAACFQPASSCLAGFVTLRHTTAPIAGGLMQFLSADSYGSRRARGLAFLRSCGCTSSAWWIAMPLMRSRIQTWPFTAAFCS